MGMVYCVFGKISDSLCGYKTVLMCVCSSKEKAIEKMKEYTEKYKNILKTATFYWEPNYLED